jgi:hypothetical protein
MFSMKLSFLFHIKPFGEKILRLIIDLSFRKTRVIITTVYQTDTNPTKFILSQKFHQPVIRDSGQMEGQITQHPSISMIFMPRAHTKICKMQSVFASGILGSLGVVCLAQLKKTEDIGLLHIGSKEYLYFKLKYAEGLSYSDHVK